MFENHFVILTGKYSQIISTALNSVVNIIIGDLKRNLF